MAPMVLLFYFFFYYASQPTLVPSPSVPTSPPAMQGLKDRQAYQSAGFPKKQPPPPPPALGPGELLAAQRAGPPSMPSTSTAAFRREHPAVSESWRQRTVSGVERGWKPQNGQEWGGGINKTALHQMTNVIFVGSLLPAGQARGTLLVYRSA